MTDDDVRRQIDQLLCKNFDAADVTASPAVIDLRIAALAPTSSRRPCRNTATPERASGSFSAGVINTPIRRIHSPCARAASGQANAVPLRAAMNFRLAMLIAIGPSPGGHARLIIVNDSTPQPASLVTDPTVLGRRKAWLFFIGPEAARCNLRVSLL
jgi:hypothetical protein